MGKEHSVLSASQPAGSVIVFPELFLTPAGVQKDEKIYVAAYWIS